MKVRFHVRAVVTASESMQVSYEQCQDVRCEKTHQDYGIIADQRGLRFEGEWPGDLDGAWVMLSGRDWLFVSKGETLEAVALVDRVADSRWLATLISPVNITLGSFPGRDAAKGTCKALQEVLP